MRNYTKLSLLLIFLLVTFKSFSQAELPSGYYVVVAAYDDTREDFAKRYTEQLKSKGENVQYGFNSTRNLFYVYVNYFTELKHSLINMTETRQKGEFIDAWVRVVSGTIVAKSSTESQPAVQTAPVKQQETVVAKQPEPVQAEPVKTEAPPVAEKPVSQSTQPVQPAQPPQPVVATAAVAAQSKEEEPIRDNDPIIQHKKMTLGNTEVFLSLFFGTKNRVVDGEVQVIDSERSRFITKVKGNDYLVLPDPKSKSGKLTLTCEVFGYRKVQHEINYQLPLADTVQDHIQLMGTTFVVEFDLVRYQKGDINTLYNVYFFNDAAIMLPESKFELTNLLELMQDTPTTKIILHGHSNGNYHGKILSLGPEKNFFTMEGAVQGMGTAKDLSQQRAETIKEYLISNGISADRIDVKAWGGKKPIFDKHSANAKKNVRVEVEVVQN